MRAAAFAAYQSNVKRRRKRVLAAAEPAEAPAQFQSGDWSVADAGTGGTITVTIATLPDDGGSSITALEYSIDGGAFTSLGGTAVGGYPITGLTDNVEVDVVIHAVNDVGEGPDSASKAVTPTSPPEPDPPSVVQTTTFPDTTNNVSMSLTLPAVITAGTLGVVVLKTGLAVTVSAVPAGWELVDEEGTNTVMRVYKKTDPFVGTEGGTVLTWTASGSTPAAFAFIEVADAVGQVEAVFAAALDPPAISPTGGADDTVILAVSCCRRTDNDCSAAPANYTAATPLMSETAAGSTSSGHVALAAASRELSAASEDPGIFTWTGTLTTDLQSVTIAIR